MTTADKLAEALYELMTCQNGCPLPSYEARWSLAMSLAGSALAAYEREKAAAPNEAASTGATRQYYYQRAHCSARNSNDADCICWWDEGTGPFLHGTDLVSLTWRPKA